MRFMLGLLVGYCIRGKQRLLIATLTAIAVVCFIVLPAITLSQLALSVRRERLSRPPQTTVPLRKAPEHVHRVSRKEALNHSDEGEVVSEFVRCFHWSPPPRVCWRAF